jgi:hypothetical protein
MKPKLFLCLVLGVLSGCSSIRDEVSIQNRREGDSFSDRETICLNTDDPSRPWQLKYALTEYTVNERKLFLTVHARGEVDSMADLSKWQPEYTAAIYLKNGEKFKLLKRLSPDGNSYFLKPVVIHANTKDGDWKQLIVVTEVYYGTGHLTKEHIFTPIVLPRTDTKSVAEVKLEEVEFTPAWEPFTEHFDKDECLWKGESNKWSDDGLSFDFIIWKYENRTHSPVARVTGTYKLEPKPGGGWRIIVDQFKRGPFTESD